MSDKEKDVRRNSV